MVVHHASNMRINKCDNCGHEECLKRVPGKINLYSKDDEKKGPVGSVVKEHIRDIREEIMETKEKFKNEWTSDE